MKKRHHTTKKQQVLNPQKSVGSRTTDRPTDGQHLRIKSPCRRLEIARISFILLLYFDGPGVV